MKSKVTPFLWFDNNAEEAMNFYVSVFGDAEVVQVTRNGEAMPGEEGSVMVATFRLGDQEIMALNGGPQFKFTEAISLFIECETQEEVDHFWNALSEGGRTDQCGWLKDRFGLSWQVVPRILMELMSDDDPVKANNVAQAMLQMTKINIDELEAAHKGA